eukprot:g66470.t1
MREFGGLNGRPHCHHASDHHDSVKACEASDRPSNSGRKRQRDKGEKKPPETDEEKEEPEEVEEEDPVDKNDSTYVPTDEDEDEVHYHDNPSVKKPNSAISKRTLHQDHKRTLVKRHKTQTSPDTSATTSPVLSHSSPDFDVITQQDKVNDQLAWSALRDSRRASTSRSANPNSSPLAAILEGIFRLRDVNPILRTDIRFALLQRINLWHHQGFITSYAHGNSNAATATIHGNAYPKAKIGIWKKVSLLVNEGQRTGNDIPQPQPDFENGAREHNFPDGVFAFQASTRRGQHVHWCECNGPTCDSRNRTSPPSRPHPFSDKSSTRLPSTPSDR